MTFVEQLTTSLFDFSLVKVPPAPGSDAKNGDPAPTLGDDTSEIEVKIIHD